MEYQVITLDLTAAGRLMVNGLGDEVNYLSANIPDGATVYARLGRPEAPRINLRSRPLLHSTCGGFELVVFEWDALDGGGTADILLAENLDSGVNPA